MSSIKLQATPTGTGVVTLTAPTTNVDRTVTMPDQTGTIYISGGDIGTPSAGNASNLTNLNASNLSTGTVPDARFPATLPAASGANLTALNASNLGSGTVPDARFPATLPAASGANLTNLNASNLSTGTVGTARLATGTANSTTFLRGDQTWATVTSLPGAQGQVFTGSGTFTIPTGITAVKLTVVGGGGNGGNASSGSCNSSFGGHGGAGGTAIKFLTGLTPGNTLTVTVGAGGGGSSSVSSGTQTITTVTGGGGGNGANSGNGASGANGAGGTGTNGDANIQGGFIDGNGNVGGIIVSTATIFSNSRFTTRPTTANGVAGLAYGGGGTGAITLDTNSRTGGAGAAGVVIIEW